MFNFYFTRQVKYENAEEWNEHSGQDQVHSVKQSLSPEKNQEINFQYWPLMFFQHLKIYYLLFSTTNTNLITAKSRNFKNNDIHRLIHYTKVGKED